MNSRTDRRNSENFIENKEWISGTVKFKQFVKFKILSKFTHTGTKAFGLI